MSIRLAVLDALRFICACLVLLFLGCEETRAQEGEEAFLQYFEPQRTVELSDEVLIGRVTSLDVSPSGDFLIADSRSRAVWIFDAEGRFKRELTPENCHPGFQMRPIAAYYASDYILLTNSGPWGYRFDMEGNCTEGMVESFSPTRQMTFDEVGNIYGFYARRPGQEDIIKMDSTGQTILSFGIEPSEFPNAVSQVSEGGLVYHDGQIYLSKVTGPEIYKYTADGKRVDVFTAVPDYYRPLKEDFPPRGTFKPGSPGIGQLMGSFTMPVNLFALGSNLLLLSWSDTEAKSGLQIYNTEGDMLAEAHGFEMWIKYAEEGRVYVVKQPDARDDGTVPNPSVKIYRYVGPGSVDR